MDRYEQQVTSDQHQAIGPRTSPGSLATPSCWTPSNALEVPSGARQLPGILLPNSSRGAATQSSAVVRDADSWREQSPSYPPAPDTFRDPFQAALLCFRSWGKFDNSVFLSCVVGIVITNLALSLTRDQKKDEAKTYAMSKNYAQQPVRIIQKRQKM
eukprot:2443963-Amphidinium_carterae.1